MKEMGILDRFKGGGLDSKQKARRTEASTKRKEAAAERRQLKNKQTAQKIENQKARNDVYKARGGHGAIFFNKAAKPAVRSNSKDIVARNRANILSDFPAKEYGVKSNADAFVREVDSYKKHHPRMSTQQAVKELVNAATIGYPYSYDRAKYLNKLGLKKLDAEKMNDWTDKEYLQMNQLYESIIVRDGTSLYNDIKSGKTVKGKRK
jgi:hypothetical protein